MLKNKILEKFLAIVLIFTLTFANFAMVTKSYAASFADTIFGSKSETGSKNVEFEAYFETEEETSVISDVNNKDLKLNMELNVKDYGYLKDAKIEIVKEDEASSLNYELKQQEELPSSVKLFEDNTIYLNQIDSDETVSLELPIEYKNEQYVSESKASSNSLVVFSGVYVDDDGKEVEVSKQITLKVSWVDERQVEVEEEATKYIDYGEGVILQTVERVNTSSEDNTLPIKQTELEVEVPKLKDVKPSKITVVANTTKGTNGKEAGEVVFSEENWEYNEEENKLKIKVENTKQTVKVNEYEDEYLQEEGKELVEEERYLNTSGIDEYLVTYTYENVSIPEEEVVTVASKVNAKMTTVSGIESEEKVAENSKEYSYDLEGQSGDIVSLNIENKNKEISKAYTYVNYNNEGKYETQIQEDMLVNISYKDIVEGIELVNTENTYVDKSGNVIENNDIYYKTISITKENFDSILGENGEIKVKEESGNQIAVINKDSQVNENGIIEIGFEEKYSRLSFEITKPIAEGNIVISTAKALGKASIAKEDLAQIEKLESKIAIRAKYNYVEETVEVGSIETETKLIDTTTEANLVIDRNSLSTVEENKDVEMRIELNNAKETSDIYGHSEFAVDLPEYIENIELTNVNLLYGEGLEISNYEVEGRTIRVTLDGKQEGINSGVLTNGTNIVMNANIKVNLFAPAKTDLIKLSYTNSEATNYVGEGRKEVEVSYSAPTGLVAVNKVTGFDDEGNTLTSLRQGKISGKLAVYSNSREVTQEIIVMNNNGNTISNMSILGRIPFIGVKDIKSGEELGTTVDSKIASSIVANEANKGNFTIYYSENGEASKDLNDENNGWTTTPESLENIKSYLIVPEDSNYVMENAEILRFSYNFYIPENLTHNETLVGTFGVNYRNNSELSQSDETEIADLVELTTGQGPELEVSMSKEVEKVKENGELSLKVTLKNVGENVAENVNVEFPIPKGSTYSRHEVDNEKPVANIENNTLKFAIPNLEIGESIEFTIYLIANSTNIEDIYQNYIEPQVNVTAKDLEAVLTANTEKIEIEFAEIYAELKENGVHTENRKLGDKIDFELTVLNSNTETLNNVVVTYVLPKEFTLVNSTEEYSYDEATRIVTWNLGNLEKFERKLCNLEVTVNELEENVGVVDVTTVFVVKANNSDEYKSNSIVTTLGRAVIKVTQTSNNENTYLKSGDAVSYSFNIKNEGAVSTKDLVLSDNIPEGININKISYKVGNIENSELIYNNDVQVDMAIEPGQECTVNLEGKATSLGGAEEKTATNVGVIKVDGNEVASSNSITYIIEATEENNSSVEQSNSSTTHSTSSSTKSGTTRTYKITGTAWVDSNEDGMRNNTEELLPGVVAKLVSSETGVIKKSVTTDASGNYTFSGVENGNYLVIFEYDTANYKVTTYQKEGVLGNVNSDVISTTISQDGKTKEGAVTDVITISNGSISNIDIGLVLANTFDLTLNKSISKVTVQTSKETTTDNYDNVNLAKKEIAAKYLSGATVYVEYTITVSNIGDLSGYAKKIVDYIPAGMTFNSSLEANKNWYTGQDGNLYTDALENVELKAGSSMSVKLVLTKQMTENNTGLINNQAEIYEDYNTYGIADINSTPANKAQGENDLSSADMIISVKTGEVFVYVSVIIITILLGSIAIFIAYNKIVLSKRKVGV